MKLLIGPRFHNGNYVVRWQHKLTLRIMPIQGMFMLKEKVARCRFRGRTNDELRSRKVECIDRVVLVSLLAFTFVPKACMYQ